MRSREFILERDRDRLFRFGQDPGDFRRQSDSDAAGTLGSWSAQPQPDPQPGSTAPPPAGDTGTDSREESDQLIAQLQAQHRRDYGRDLKINSGPRTREEQQDLYRRWQRGEPGIYIPRNPDDYPGRRWFHTRAVDISQGTVDEAWMNQQGWYRTNPTQDPVHWEYRGAPLAAKPAQGAAAQPQRPQTKSPAQQKSQPQASTGNPSRDAILRRQQREKKQ